MYIGTSVVTQSLGSKTLNSLMDCSETAVSRRCFVKLFGLAIAVPHCIGPSQAGTAGAELAIKGYDPVAYFTLGKPTPGSPDITFDWDEHRYQFARVEHRDIFKADPPRYAPQFANYCAMALTRGETDEANPENWLVRDGKLFIFGKSIGPGLFQQAFNENVAKAESNRHLFQKR